MKMIRVSDNLNNELRRIQKMLQEKEQREISMLDTTDRVSRVLKKVKV